MKALHSLPAVLFFSVPLMAQEQGKVIRSAHATDAKTGVTVAAVSVELPADTTWRLEELPKDAPLSQAVLIQGDEVSRRGQLSAPANEAKTVAPWNDSYVVYGLVGGTPAPVELKFSS